MAAVAGPNGDGNRALTRRRNKFPHVEHARGRRLETEALQSGKRQQRGGDFALGNLGEARLDIAAQQR